MRIAREAAHVTQAEAAQQIGIARTTLVAVEREQRRARLHEVRRLAALYGTSANALLRRESVHVDLAPRFRKLMTTGDGAAREAARALTTLVSAEIELERVLGIDHTRNYPPERPLLPGDVRIQAERDAAEVRHWLGLGLSPIHDLVSLMELHLGIRHDAARVAASGSTGVRLSPLAEAALSQELLSEGQLARLLCVSRVDLRRMFEGGDSERSEMSGPELP